MTHPARASLVLVVTVAGLCAALLVSGAWMWVRATPDLELLGALRVHIRTGLVCWTLFLFTTIAGGVRRTHPLFVLAALLLALGCVPLLIFSAGFVPMELAVAGCVALLAGFGVLFAWRQSRRTPSGWVPLVAIAWPAALLALASGTYLGVFKSLGTISNVLHHVHGASALVLAAVGVRALRLAAPSLSRAPGYAYQLALAIAIPLGLTWLGADVVRAANARPPGEAVPPTPAMPAAASTDAAYAKLGALTRPSSGCGLPECHLESHQEWAVSAHRFSATNRVYRHAVEKLAARAGWPVTAECARCHDPLVAQAGGHEGWTDEVSERLRDEGVSCAACHAMDQVAEPIGGGHFTLRKPDAYLPEPGGESETRAALEQELIYTWVRPHRASYMPPLRKRAELCAPCHEGSARSAGAFVPPRSPESETDRAHTIETFSSWRATGFPAESIGCRECHMHMFELNWQHPPWDHHIFGHSTQLARLVPARHASDPELVQAAEASSQYLRGTLAVRPSLIDYLKLKRDPQAKAYEAYYAGMPLLDVRIEGVDRLRPGAESTLTVTTSSRRLGHSFPSVARSGEEIWLELEIADASGTPLYREGAVSESEALPPTSRWLGREPGPAVVGGLVRRIEPGRQHVETFAVTVPAAARGPFTARARWRHRALAPWLAREVLGAGSAPLAIDDLS